MTQRTNTQLRHFEFEVSEGRALDDGIPVVISSDAVVEVADGPEVLLHTRDAIDLARAPLPIIATHRTGQVNVGVVDNLTIEGGRLRGTARFGSRPEAAGYREDVQNRIIRSVSVGYARIKASVRADGVLMTSRWMPTHTALVAEPADINAGFFRSLDSVPAFEIEPESQVSQPAASIAATIGVAAMADTQAAAGQSVAEPKIVVTEDHSLRQGAMQIEQNRVEAVRNLCKANNIDGRTEATWISDGTQLDVVAREILGIQVARQSQNKTYAASLGLTQREAQRYSMFRALRAQYYRSPEAVRDAAFEIECSREVARKIGRGETSSILVPADLLAGSNAGTSRRDMSVVPGASGGYLVETQNMGFLDMLRNKNATMIMGATRVALEGNASFVRQTGGSTIRWQAGENVATTSSDQTLGQLSMTPKTAIAWTRISEQLLRQSSPSAEQFVMNDLAQTLATGIDSAVINGTGGAQPLGILNTTGVTTSQDAATVTYDKLLAFWSTARGSNAVLSNPGWMTNAAGARVLKGKQRFTSTDTPMWVGNPEEGSVIDFRAISTQQIAGSGLIFGSWGEIIIGEWGVLELAASNGGTDFESGSVKIRAVWMVDVMLRYPQAFVVSSNLSA